MKNWFSTLFGGHAEAPAVSTPLRSPEDLKLDAIRAKYCRCRRIVYDDPLFADWRAPWRKRLDDGYRFVLITLPWLWRREGSSDDVQSLVFPHRRDLPHANLFEEFCRSSTFADLIREDVIDWQLEALAWNAECGPAQRYTDEAIACPQVFARLLDDDNDPPPLCRVLARRFDPPTPPAPVAAQPPQPRPGIGQAMPLPKKKTRKLSR